MTIKINESQIIINNNAYCRYLRVAPGEHTYLPKKTGIFRVKIIIS